MSAYWMWALTIAGSVLLIAAVVSIIAFLIALARWGDS
jgi:hypothetical protein